MPVCCSGVFYPCFGYLGNFAQIAQSVEHVLGKDEVTGSIPVLGLDMKLEKLSFFSEASARDGEREI